MTDAELETKLMTLVKEERRITSQILELINLAAERKLYLDRGFETLFDWLTKGFGYSESAARRRISAALLLKSVPQAAEKIQTGAVNISTLAKAQSAIRIQEKATGQRLSPEFKAEIVAKIERKSLAQTEQTLVTLLPETVSSVYQERKTVVNENTSRLSTNFSNETMADLDRVRELLSHSLPQGSSYNDVIAHLAKEFLKRKDPLRKPEPKVRSTKPKQKTPSQGATKAIHSRVTTRGKIPAAIRHAVIKRDQGQCVFQDPRTKQICGSRNRITLDHIYPKTLGGEDTIENLRCLCAAHNNRAAELTLGHSWANAWRSAAQESCTTTI